MQDRLFYVLFCTFSLSLLKFGVSSHCDASDRTYSCNCIFEPSNETVFVEEKDKYNVSADHFIPAIKSLRYCQGSFHCKPNIIQSDPLAAINTDNCIICFSDDSCLSNGGIEVSSLSDTCMKNSCMYLENLIEFKITNSLLEVGAYMCIRIGPEGLNVPYCLKPACKSFVAIEKLCSCNYEIHDCRCSSYCQNLLISSPHKTYALFLSFGDIYTSKEVKRSFLHWIVLIILCFGLILLLVIFCRLCKVAVDPTCGNEGQNSEMLRRMFVTNIESVPPQTSTAVKNSFSDIERNSPPPSYEQVLKDKCTEFKKSHF